MGCHNFGCHQQTTSHSSIFWLVWCELRGGARLEGHGADLARFGARRIDGFLSRDGVQLCHHPLYRPPLHHREGDPHPPERIWSGHSSWSRGWCHPNRRHTGAAQPTVISRSKQWWWSRVYGGHGCVSPTRCIERVLLEMLNRAHVSLPPECCYYAWVCVYPWGSLCSSSRLRLE